MAYEALISLTKKLDRILDQQNTSFSSRSDEEGRSFDCSFLRNSCFSPNGEKRCSTCAALQKKIEIQSLHENTVFLSSFLEDFPEEAANLEARLLHAAKQVKYTIDRHAFNCYGIVPDENDPELKHVCQELDKSIEEIGVLLQEAKRVKSRSRAHSLPPSLNTVYRENILGLEKDFIEIKDRLYGYGSTPLHIAAMVGMAGIGKTILAKHIFNDTSTIDHFDVRAWASVSQFSSAEKILSSLLSSIDPSNAEKYQCMDKESLVVYGHRYLKNRRFLMVLDDVWGTNVWDDVRRAFPDDCNGSRIIITTRDLEVASYVDSSNKPHKMQLLSVDQSWRLLTERVFGKQNCPPELENIGVHIAEKCKGLPLALVAMAGVLSNLERKQDLWEKVARNVSEAVNSCGDEQYLDILSVSYMHLPRHLRPCFLYMGLFPEDCEINVSTLIRLWTAEGYLVSNESKDMEELGYQYLEDLTRRSLLMTEKKSYDGMIKTVKIHDVLRDLCIRKRRDENFHHIINEFCGGILNMESFSGKILDATTRTSFPDEITELNHLTYLALAFDTTDKSLRLEVPESLSKLQNLQTLVLRPSDYFSFTAILPVSIWRMPQLRHIILHNGILPDPCTDDCREALPLRNLHTLSRIESFTCSDRILELLPNLKKLGMNYSASDLDKTGWSRYGLNNLVRMECLEKLSIYVSNSYKNVDAAPNLAFPMTLKILTLSGCVITWENMSIIGSLSNLEVLKLKRIISQGTLWETAEGEFCELKVLLIDTTDLHQWITESSHFPRLEKLTLYECSRLQEIPRDIGEISTLQSIEVDIRNLSIVRSAKAIQREQQSFGNDLEVRILKSRSWKRNLFF